MIKRLLTIAFLVAITASSFAVIPPHMEGEGGCSMTCCQAARQGQSGSVLSTLCCIVDCKQSAGTSMSPTTNTIVGAAQRLNNTIAQFIPGLETNHYIQQTRFPLSPTRYVAGSSARYLDIGAFLI